MGPVVGQRREQVPADGHEGDVQPVAAFRRQGVVVEDDDARGLAGRQAVQERGDRDPAMGRVGLVDTEGDLQPLDPRQVRGPGSLRSQRPAKSGCVDGPVVENPERQADLAVARPARGHEVVD